MNVHELIHEKVEVFQAQFNKKPEVLVIGGQFLEQAITEALHPFVFKISGLEGLKVVCIPAEIVEVMLMEDAKRYYEGFKPTGGV